MGASLLFFVLICANFIIKVELGGDCSTRCEWSGWSSWSECNRKCAGGHQKRSREYCCDAELEIEDCMAACGKDYNTMRRGFRETKGCNEDCDHGGQFLFSGHCQCPARYRGTCCQDVVTCGQPSTISHGSFTGSDFTYAGKIQYTCNKKYNMTIPSQSTRTCSSHGYWNGSNPTCLYATSCESSPCKNGASCENLLGDYRCVCLSGWTGKNCEIDVQPPIVQGCPADRNIVTSDLTSRQNWSEPNITDPHGTQVVITKNYQKSEFVFPWGEFTIQYSAVKPSNGLRAECKFNISVKPFPCKKMDAPTDGMILCNGWRQDYSQVCVFVCKTNYTLPPGYKADDIYVCGATGNWLPVNPVPHCVSKNLFPASQVKSFSTCTEPADKKMISEFYIEFLKKSAVNALCEQHADACVPDNVDIRC
ncbi:sushi, von Willebrand factor type A, EGF and pentraxin domain-containing protein 1-like [Ruditapes philippinarum]|uniref:sushi, von Willebrand factor type A, EGF and pentraxin domain-containing protein 1-like n=1 Tax=Ruditapes philippinarum TaxID=129788 RepID=UPI00295AFDF4|nr:sushi, von Willebrand factor type A, EGF and pentraxin domain-containing protein 1-like [Ruditapes philippinarum]